MEQQKFYQKTWFLWVMLIFLPPAGIILLWVNKPFSTPVRSILTGVFALWFLLIVFFPGSETDVPATGNPEEIAETPSSVVLVSNDEFLSIVLDAIDGDVGENEYIVGATLNDKELMITVDFSQLDHPIFSKEDIALSRTSSITDTILALENNFEYWDAITVDFGEVGYITNKKDNINDEGFGLYFEPSNFEILGSSLNNSTPDTEPEVIDAKGLGITTDEFLNAYNVTIKDTLPELAASISAESSESGMLTLSINENNAIMLYLLPDGEEIESITYIGTGDGTAESGANILIGMIATVQAVDSSLDSGPMILELFEEPSTSQTHNGLQYSIMTSEYIGTWLIIEAE